MQWGEGAVPLSLSNFETQARLKRYRLLAQAAKEAGIPCLFLGHHQDDQIETVIMRLIRGKSGSLANFWGIAAEAPIPADAESGHELASSWDSGSDEHLHQTVGESKSEGPVEDCGGDLPRPTSMNSLGGRIPIAQRLDVSLYRPLLNFSKTRILATCRTNNIPFVLDPTNLDPQITLRNAVRYLLANYKLPRALSRDAILKVHDRALKRLKVNNFEVQQLLNIAQLTSLDLRSGSLTLRLPKFSHLLEWECSETPTSFLAQILRLVSPIDDYEVSRYSQGTAANFVFPSKYLSLHGQPAAAPVTSLAVNQVLVTREDPPKNTDQQSYVSWRLSRQPFKHEQMRKLTRRFAYQPKSDHDTAAKVWSVWLLWDCRYWIRICCINVQYLQTCAVRPFQASDATKLRKTLDRESKETLTRLLYDAAPGKVRYTLPVITDAMGVRAFPTLDFAVPKHERDSSGHKDSKSGLLSWKVQYKFIDRKTIGRLNAHESFSSGRYRAAAEEYLENQTRHPKVD